MNKKNDLRSLVSACQYVGSHAPYWVQGGGGNISRKIGKFLWIKASGRRLSDVSAHSGLVSIDDTRLIGQWAAIEAAADPDEAYRECLERAVVERVSGENPSMESILHAVLPGKWVLHFHPITAILIATSEKRWERFKLAAETLGLKVSRTAYVAPGWKLGAALRAYVDSDVILLENHGIVLQSNGESNGANEILSRWTACEQTVARELGLPTLAQMARVLSPVPWRVYFPDAAVFEDRVKKIVKKEANGSFSLPESAWHTDQAAAEIFYVTQAIWLADQNVSVLSESAIQSLKQMSFEKLRLSKEGKGEAA